METYCVSCKENTANKKLSVRKTKQNILVLLSSCAILATKNQFLLKIKNCIKDLLK